jgi:hypothetical protein
MSHPFFISKAVFFGRGGRLKLLFVTFSCAVILLTQGISGAAVFNPGNYCSVPNQYIVTLDQRAYFPAMPTDVADDLAIQYGGKVLKGTDEPTGFANRNYCGIPNE